MNIAKGCFCAHEIDYIDYPWVLIGFTVLISNIELTQVLSGSLHWYSITLPLNNDDDDDHPLVLLNWGILAFLECCINQSEARTWTICLIITSLNRILIYHVLVFRYSRLNVFRNRKTWSISMDYAQIAYYSSHQLFTLLQMADKSNA